MLRSHARYLHARRPAEQLRTALESRAVIDQAKGAIMDRGPVRRGPAAVS
ncbi:ANTAR domain-containing protein [Lentzea sp. NBRC 105346]|nr:ANTAR domain-containing protein [Lentzea sp. NBRC 105346]